MAGGVFGGSGGDRMPNFRLVEFFLNAFTATRAYRSCRQCLLAYYRVLSAIHTAPVSQLVPLPPYVGDDGKLPFKNSAELSVETWVFIARGAFGS